MTILVALKGFAFGPVGSDAGYWVIGTDGRPHHVGGWGEREKAEVGAALATLGAAAQVTDRAMQARLLDTVQAMLKPHMGYLQSAGQEAGKAA
ncbi:MAG: hypothetical protein AAGC69_20140 [Paracraurococcus sp.]|jgi:hypothetical protein